MAGFSRCSDLKRLKMARLDEYLPTSDDEEKEDGDENSSLSSGVSLSVAAAVEWWATRFREHPGWKRADIRGSFRK